MGAAWLLPRIVGYGHASQMLLTGEFVDAKRAYEIGLYNRVVPQAQVLPEARAMAEQLARGPSVALGVTKQALETEASLDLEAALAYEAEVQARLMQDQNFREARGVRRSPGSADGRHDAPFAHFSTRRVTLAARVE
jgi:enoyl-CoA hydratase/carnithine racemase